eukprot:2996329-Amphidinium_carterae.1
MADSGAMRTVIAPWAFTSTPLHQHKEPAPHLRSITGESLTLHGVKELKSTIEGAQLKVCAHVAEVQKSALSLPEVVSSGFT